MAQERTANIKASKKLQNYFSPPRYVPVDFSKNSTSIYMDFA